jgi:hypothetical protein
MSVSVCDLTEEGGEMGKKEIKEELKERAISAKCDLAWLAATHWGVRNEESSSIKVAEDILLNPHKLENKRGERIFSGFSKFYKSKKKKCKAPSDDAGHYLNKSAVVYADAIIQAFLGDSSLIFSQIHKLQKKSVGGMLDEINEKLRKLLSYREVCSAKHVRFIAQLRHVITHNSGEVDEQFFQKCTNDEECTSNGKLYDETIWSEEKFEKDFAIGKQVSLPVGEVVIPYLKHAFDFVDDHRKQLNECL